MSRKQYTDKQKAAYYKKKAAGAARAPAKSFSGRGTYVASKPKRRVARQRSTARTIGDYAPGVGAAIGSSLGGPIGGIIGGAGGALIKHFIGRGEYEVTNNCFLKNGNFMEPIINPHKSGGDVFRRSEYLADVITASSAGTFQNVTYDVNPGLENTFQWLSQIACNYEEYSIEGMYFEYRSMSADALNSTNTALGQVIMAANYNSAAPAFTNKQAMENYEGGVSCRPSANCRYFVECEPHRSVLDNMYVRNGAVPENQDQRMYDLCKFQIATNGFQGTAVNLGELWVEYQVCLRKPKLYAALGLLSQWASLTTSTNQFTGAQPLGTGTMVASPTTNIIGISITNGTALSWKAPTLPQCYQITLHWEGNSAVGVIYPTLAVANGFVVKNQYNAPKSGADQYVEWVIQLVYLPLSNISNLNPTLTFGSSGTLPLVPSAFLCQIVQLPNTIYGI